MNSAVRVRRGVGPECVGSEDLWGSRGCRGSWDVVYSITGRHLTQCWGGCFGIWDAIR